MNEGVRRRIQKLECAAQSPRRSEPLRVSALCLADRQFFERIKSHRFAGGAFTSDAERARYHDLLLGLDGA